MAETGDQGPKTPGDAGEKPPSNRKREKGPGPTLYYLMIGIALAVVLFAVYGAKTRGKEIPYGEFVAGLKSGKYTSENVFELRVTDSYIRFQDQPAPKREDVGLDLPDGEDQTDPDVVEAAVSANQYYIPIGGIADETRAELIDLIGEAGILVRLSEPQTEWMSALSILMILLMLLLIITFFRRMGGAGTAMSFGRSRGKLLAEDDIKATFNDVAGIDEAVEELREVVEFLRTPGKYQALGGRIPRGVLLVGPPGTGKTLLAKAVAGEAGVPFFSLSGSDFVEMFVGVGAARVRDMFSQAAARAPSIIFIDELDALGKTRGSGMPGGQDEREQTLNALLVEMDGFSSEQSVIVMGATNRPETLDPALMRPGRFDRNVLVDRPDYKGREAILKVHAKRIKMDNDVDLPRLAKLTPGFVGADLENLVNEAALLAARKDKTAVGMAEFEEGIERVIAGLEKTTRIIQEDEKQRVAYHECGHALVACALPQTDPVHKISIIPRGFGALGYTLQRPEDDRHLVTQTELKNRVCVLLGGIAAEELVYQETSTGAQNDLERGTDIARRMVTEFGMSPKLGRVNYRDSGRSPFLQGSATAPKDYVHSEQTIREIDLEVRRIIDECMQIARDTLADRREVLEHMTRDLIEQEVMDADQLQKILDAHQTGPKIKPGTYVEKSDVEDAPSDEDGPRESVDGA